MEEPKGRKDEGDALGVISGLKKLNTFSTPCLKLTRNALNCVRSERRRGGHHKRFEAVAPPPTNSTYP